jgi:hypothetical protein
MKFLILATLIFSGSYATANEICYYRHVTSKQNIPLSIYLNRDLPKIICLSNPQVNESTNEKIFTLQMRTNSDKGWSQLYTISRPYGSSMIFPIIKRSTTEDNVNNNFCLKTTVKHQSLVRLSTTAPQDIKSFKIEGWGRVVSPCEVELYPIRGWEVQYLPN